MATRLTKLELDEVSGVEHPANETPGFMVIKSMAENLPADEAKDLLKQVDRMESDFAILYSALNSCQQYIADAPQDVQDALTTLMQYIEGLFNAQSQDNTAPPPPATPPAPIAGSKEKDGRSLLKRLLHRDIIDKNEETQVADTEKTEKTAAEVETEAAEKSGVEKSDDAPETPDIAEITKALSATADALGEINTKLDKLDALEATVEATKDALGATLDRVSSLEVHKQADDGYTITAPAPVSKEASKTERAQAALRGELVRIAQNPGTMARLG